MTPRLKKIFTFIIFCFCLSCGNSKISYHYPKSDDIERKSRSGKFSTKSWSLASSKQSNDNKENEFSILWKSATEVVTAIFPISVIDEKSGIIASEWYQENEDSLKRIKINILIRDKTSIDKALRVSVFQQKKSSKAAPWQGNVLNSPESVADSAMKAEKIKEQIVKKAKLMKEKNEARS
jgi:hypothetical protein